MRRSKLVVMLIHPQSHEPGQAGKVSMVADIEVPTELVQSSELSDDDFLARYVRPVVEYIRRG